MSPEHGRALIERLIGRSQADHVSVSLRSHTSSNLRFARNMVTTSGETTDRTVRVTVTFGTKSGTASTNQLDDASLDAVVTSAEELAQLSPEDPEFVPPLGPQDYEAVEGWVEPSGPEAMAEHVATVIERAGADKLVAAGFAAQSAGWSFLGNSAGLRAQHRWSEASMSSTVRTPDGQGSGWANRLALRSADLDAAGLADDAVRKAKRSRGAQAMDPGPVRAILEPACVASLLQGLGWSLDARDADEGRSFFSGAAGGNRIGERLLSKRVTIRTDPRHPLVPVASWARSGLPVPRITWFEGGVLKTLPRGRYWARETGTEPVPEPANVIMEGGSGTVDDLVADTERGVLITCLWYVRSVDRRTLLFTGLTRDGVFRIENGEIVAPLTNFRWNDSPITVFRGIEAMSEAVAVAPRGSSGQRFVVPAVRTSSFTLSSVSDAV